MASSLTLCVNIHLVDRERKSIEEALPLLNHLDQEETHVITAHSLPARTSHIVPPGYKEAWGLRNVGPGWSGFPAIGLRYGKGICHLCQSKAQGVREKEQHSEQ